MRHKLLFLFFFLCVFKSFAQDLLVNAKLFTQEDGLSYRDIRAVKEDDRGFIWVATGNGLNRFDGKEFKRIEGEGEVLNTGYIEGIKKDAEGKFWLQPQTGPVIVFDPLLGKIDTSLVWNKKKENDLRLAYYRGSGQEIFLIDANGKIFYYKEGSLTRFGEVVVKTEEFRYIKPSNRHSLYLINEDKVKRQIKEITEDGRILLDIKGPKPIGDIFESENNLINNFSNQEKAVGFIHEDLFSINEKEGTLDPIVLKRNKKPLKWSDLYPEEWSKLDAQEGIYYYLKKDREDNYWLSINNKLFVFDENRDFLFDLSPKAQELLPSVSFKVTDMYFDSFGRLWMSTNAGLFLFEITENQFQQYLKEDMKYSIRGMTELSSEDLLVSTYRGVQKVNKKTGAHSTLHDNAGLVVVDINKDTILVGTHSEEYLQYSKISGSIDRINDKEKKLERQIKTLFLDSLSSQLFLGTNEGLFVERKTKGGELLFEPYRKLNEFSILQNNVIEHFYQNSKGLWICTTNGIFLLEKDVGISQHFTFPNKSIKHLHEDRQGNFWLATGGGGLIRWHPEKETMQQFTKKDGLSHNLLYAVYPGNSTAEKESDYLWLTSNNGLMRFHRFTYEVDVFHTKDGINHGEFNTYSHYKGKDGRLYFGGLDGILSFNPDSIKIQSNDVPLLITEVQQYVEAEEELKDITDVFLQNQQITLAPGDRFFSLRFVLLDYSAQYVDYAWKIEGLDSDWNYQVENNLRINALPYGDFNLKVKAKSSGGKWNKQEISIPIHVVRPLYMRKEFIAACVIALLGIIFLFVKWRLQSLEKTKEKLEQQVKDRTGELLEKNKELEVANQFKDKVYSIIAHDLRGPAFALQDVGNKISYLIETEQTERLKNYGSSVDESISSLNNLLDNLLKWAKQNMNTIRVSPELLSVKELIAEVLVDLKGNMKKKGIEVETTLPIDISIYADRPTTLTVLRNLLSNAIKFSNERGRIIIEAEEKKQIVFIKIVDNGVGIAEDRISSLFDIRKSKSTTGTLGEKGTGLGLNVSKELLLLNKGNIEVSSTLGKGSVFCIQLPADSP